MKKNILLIIILCITVNVLAQQKDSIKLNRFYPEYFSEVKTGFNLIEDEKNCCPQDPDAHGIWEGLLINCPQRIYYFPGIDTVPQFPYCSFEKVSRRKLYLYAFDYNIFVKNVVTDSLIVDVLGSETRKQRLDNLETSSFFSSVGFNRNFRTKLSSALNSDNTLVVKKRTINIFDYLNLPFKSGIYDVYIQFCNYDSNHTKTEIVFANERTIFFPETFNHSNLGFQFDMNSKCHPQLPNSQNPDFLSCLKINIPSEVYHYPNSDTTTILPIYSSSVSLIKEDESQLVNIVQIFIKDIKNSKTYKGVVDFKGKDAMGNTDSKYINHYPQTPEERIENISEFKEGVASVRAFNINALDFVDMPYKAGEYEVWVKRAGYESNHMKVTIKFFYEK